MIQVVTVARQLGAGGREIATRLADSLGWRLLDRALVERVAAELRADLAEVEACDERVASFGERLGVALAEMYPEITPLPALTPVSPELTARAVRRIVAGVVEEGPSAIVGHGAQCVLRDDPRAFHVLIHAPLEHRVERAMERYQVGREEARERIATSDADRRRYLRENFHQEWLDPSLYQLCLDSGRLGIDATVSLIRAAIDGCGQAPPSDAPLRGGLPSGRP